MFSQAYTSGKSSETSHKKKYYDLTAETSEKTVAYAGDPMTGTCPDAMLATEARLSTVPGVRGVPSPQSIATAYEPSEDCPSEPLNVATGRGLALIGAPAVAKNVVPNGLITSGGAGVTWIWL